MMGFDLLVMVALFVAAVVLCGRCARDCSDEGGEVTEHVLVDPAGTAAGGDCG